MKLFFMVLARDRRCVSEKIAELNDLNVPFIAVCGEQMGEPSVIYREPKGKWDAINFGSQFVPEGTDAVVLNDVDTKIHNFDHALSKMKEGVDLIYCRVEVPRGPQTKFYKFLNPIRKRLHVAASGELMLIRREVFDKVLPVPPCLAEDSYILFKALELGYLVHFCTEAYVTTERTSNAEDEEAYKARTTLGIYQALDNSNPPVWIKIFYKALPFAAPMLVLGGKDGSAWAKGIMRAVKSHMRGEGATKF